MTEISTKKKFPIVAVILAIVLVVAAVIIFFAIMAGGEKKKAAAQIDLGNKYLNELKYEDAIAAFEMAISINPKSKDAYKGIINAYMGKGDYKKAKEYIKEGYRQTGDSEFKDMLANFPDGDGPVADVDYDADYIRKKINAFAAADVEYDYVTCYYSDDSRLVGTVKYSDSYTFSSDENHEYKEGYQWTTALVTYTFSGTDVQQKGYRTRTFAADYNNMDVFAKSYKADTSFEGIKHTDDTISYNTFTVNYNGTDYSECKAEQTLIKNEIEGSTGTFAVRVYFRVPVGYDGIVIGSYNAANENSGARDWRCIDDNTLFFRVSY